MRSIKTIVALLLTLFTSTAFAQSTEFNFQGSLREGAAAATGNFDFEFALFDGGGAQLGSTISRSSVGVSNGSFTVVLDFGDQFGGGGRFIEVRVRPAGGGAFTTLTPRQPVNSSPYSIRSLIANDSVTSTNFRGSLAGDVVGPQNATSIAVGAVTATKLADGSVITAKLADGSVNVAKLGDGSVNVFKLGDGSVTNPKLADGSVNVAKLGDGSVNVAKLGDGSVTNPKIANSAISALKIAPGQVVKGINGLTDAVTLVAGANISISADANTITFAGTGGGSANAILNQTTLQPSSNFNISGSGTAGGTFSANIVSATTQFNSGNDRLLAATASNNTFGGIGAGVANTGFDNTFFGRGAGQTNSGGNSNSFFGTSSGIATISGSANSFFGRTAGLANTFGNSNVFIGVGTGIANNTGNANVFVGTGAADANTEGNFNVAVGTGAGDVNTTGDSNTLIGYNSDVGSGNLSHATAIGANALVTTSNTVVLGRTEDTVRVPGAFATAGQMSTSSNLVVFGTSLLGDRLTVTGGGDASLGGGGYIVAGPTSGANLVIDNNEIIARDNGGTSTLYLNTNGGNVSIGTLTNDQRLTVNGNASKVGGGTWAVFSDERLKNINGRFSVGLDAIRRLDPIRFEYRPDNALGLANTGEHVGFSAQEVQKVIPEAVTTTSSGYLQLNSDPILWAMLNAIKEQQKQIEDLKTIVCDLKPLAAVCRK